MKDDPRYVKFLVRIFGIENGQEYERIIPFYKCKEEDWEMFPPPTASSVDAINAIKSNPKRGMYCLDQSMDEFKVYGNERNDFYQRIEIVLVPCNYLHTKWGYDGDSIDEECIADLD